MQGFQRARGRSVLSGYVGEGGGGLAVPHAPPPPSGAPVLTPRPPPANGAFVQVIAGWSRESTCGRPFSNSFATRYVRSVYSGGYAVHRPAPPRPGPWDGHVFSADQRVTPPPQTGECAPGTRGCQRLVTPLCTSLASRATTVAWPPFDPPLVDTEGKKPTEGPRDVDRGTFGHTMSNSLASSSSSSSSSSFPYEGGTPVRTALHPTCLSACLGRILCL